MNKQKSKAQANDAPLIIEDAAKEEGDPTIIEDATIVGIFIAKEHKVIPGIDERKHVHFNVYGDVERSLREIYSNTPIGSMDVLNGIKLARQMIYMLRAGGAK